MNEIINRFLFGGDKFMPGMHSRKPTALANLVLHSVVMDYLEKKQRKDSKI